MQRRAQLVADICDEHALALEQVVQLRCCALLGALLNRAHRCHSSRVHALERPQHQRAGAEHLGRKVARLVQPLLGQRRDHVEEREVPHRAKRRPQCDKDAERQPHHRLGGVHLRVGNCLGEPAVHVRQHRQQRQMRDGKACSCRERRRQHQRQQPRHEHHLVPHNRLKQLQAGATRRGAQAGGGG
eukprot:366009-Chlamydomonas_euryale.AAC.1